ncbi:MAG: histidine phosphatase family protein [Anaerolineae bacterium]|nr:histidine phosphatase family protein [Thermoflexales bacterium]MDW8407167.1 histidine phosphatase family protein [Anaerolineae bacterium]
MTTLFLIRHAQSMANEEGRIQGWLDSPLSELGRQQAQALAERFRSIRLHAVYSSPLSRARDTAQAIAHLQKLPVLLDERLKEYNMGHWTGLSREEIQALWPSVNLEADHELVVPGGESAQDVRNRVELFLREAMAQGGDQSLAIVTHSGTLGMVVCAMLGMPVMRRPPFYFGNASVTEVTYRHDRWRLRRLNDQCHLHPLELTGRA